MYEKLFEKSKYEDCYVVNLKYRIYKFMSGVVQHGIEELEKNRFLHTHKFPLVNRDGVKIYFDKDGYLHNWDGPAICGDIIPAMKTDYNTKYFIKGFNYSHNEFLKLVKNRRPYFSREKIITLQKLLEIPELFQEVYYEHKNTFLPLLNKF